MDALLDEVESLEAILMEDVEIKRNPETGIPELIETTIFPIVGGDTDQQYICVTLQVLPKYGYPDVMPDFNLLRPRGLDDTRLDEIRNACVKKLNESVGYPVVFDLIDVIREHLTGSNLPSGQCVVCLYGFREGDQFAKTECYHYLHSYCLARHLIASKRNYQEEQDKLPPWLKKMSDPFQAVCPICRETIKDDVDHLKDAPPPAELENAPEFQLTDDLKELQMKMTNLFLHQKSRGAIIDLEAEDSNIISIEPEDQTNNDRRKTAENSSDEGLQENGSEIQQNNFLHSSAQTTTNTRQGQNQSRANQNRNQSRPNNITNSAAAAINSAAGQRCSGSNAESANNSNYTYQQSRRHHHHNHHHHHHRGRRHHQYHNYQNSSHSQTEQQQDSGKQKTTNVHASSGSSTR